MQEQLNPGTTIGSRYQIIAAIGDGGYGQVYRARHLGLEIDVAVKTLKRDDKAPESEAQDNLARFKLEAKALTRLKHPAIVNVLDFGLAETTPYLVMDYFDGQQLLTWGEAKTPTTKQWLAVFRQIFEALGHAHQQGILHRDIKTENVLVGGAADNAKVQIIDWGIAYTVGADRRTKTDSLIGSRGSIDPYLYQHPSEDCVPQGDFYSVGNLLYRALCGREPFRTTKEMSDSQRQLVIMNNKIVPPRKVLPEISKTLDLFMLRLLATEREYRPPSSQVAIAIIDRLLAGEEFDIDEFLDASKPAGEAPAPKPKTMPAVASQAAADKRDDLQWAEVKELAGAAGQPPTEAPKKQEAAPIVMPANLGGGVLDATSLPPSLPPRREVKVDPPKPVVERNAAKFGINIPPGQASALKRYGLPVGAAVAGAVLMLILTNRLAARSSQEVQETVVAHPVTPDDLVTPHEESTLGKFATARSAQTPGANLGPLSPDIKAEYPQATPSGDSLVAQALPAHVRGTHRLDDETTRPKNDIDKTLRPILPTTDGARGRDDHLAVPYNTEAEARLVDSLDTSSNEPVHAELLRSLSVSGDIILPIGSVLLGQASLKHNRPQVHFDRVSFPDGSEHKISAIAISRDGREGIEGGRFEFGDAAQDKTGQNILSAMGTIASQALSTALPGTDILSTGAQNLASNEIHDATQGKSDAPRAKNRITLQRKTTFTIRFTGSI